MVKKVRLIDEDTAEAQTENSVTEDSIDPEQLMKFLEAIDWKLWELLKLARKHLEE